MWAKLRASKDKGKEVIRNVRKSFNLNEEYRRAFRTKSYADFFDKAQPIVRQPSSSPSSEYQAHNFLEILLDPSQESIPGILESAILSRIPELKGLMLKYFDISAEASKLCTHLLKSIHNIQSSYHFFQQALDKVEDYSPQNVATIVSDINLFIVQNHVNSFSNPNNCEFKLIHDKYSSVFHHLRLMRKKVARKIKFIKYIKKASAGICITAACSLVTIIVVVLAGHCFVALLMGPAIFSFPPFKRLKKKFSSCIPFFRSRVLRKVGEQLDVAAKGTYILNRDLDTMSRLVARLHDEVEHNKMMIHFCLERKEADLYSLHVVKELKKANVGFRKQVEELQEHVYLCLVTINRARNLVIKEMTKSCMGN